MQLATAAIASGALEHRIDSPRRDELGDLARSIDHMAERLRHLEASRRRMLAAVSHELRTPLTIIRGNAYTLSRAERVPARQARFDVIDREAEHLNDLIGELLSAAAWQAQPPPLRTELVAASDLVQAALDRFATAAEQHGIRLVARTRRCRNAQVRVDSERIGQALGNLVANAMAHAPGGTSIVVGAEARSDSVVLWVRNAGPAIPKAFVPHVFEPFMQGERATGSVGLGLSIVRDIAHAHGGNVSLTSSEGRTEFRIELPNVAPAEAAVRQLAPRYA
jgi:two-component system sensor histidine kinase BaeS